MFLEPASEVPLEEIIRGMSIVSANDASVALAEYLGGDVAGFVRMMNAKARELGMSESWFVNPHGLPARGQVSTARDLMKLARSYIERFPEAMTIHALRNYTYHDITQKNRNRLLGRFAGADGLKTGYVAEAGYHLIATARRGDTRLIAVVLGAKTPRIREKESLNLLEAGFRMLEKSRPTMTNSKKWRKENMSGSSWRERSFF